MRLGKSAKAMHQPFGGKIRRSADGQSPRALPLHQTLGAQRDPVQSIAYNVEVLAAGFGDHQPLAFAIEELDAEFGLQRLDLMADRALGNTQLLRGAREALVPRGSLERL